MIAAIQQTGQSEALELVYANFTDDLALIEAQDGTRFRFDDGAEAYTLTDAVDQGKALVGFAVNQLRQF